VPATRKVTLDRNGFGAAVTGRQFAGSVMRPSATPVVE
jgi:hypothetical protein